MCGLRGSCCGLTSVPQMPVWKPHASVTCGGRKQLSLKEDTEWAPNPTGRASLTPEDRCSVSSREGGGDACPGANAAGTLTVDVPGSRTGNSKRPWFGAQAWRPGCRCVCSVLSPQECCPNAAVAGGGHTWPHPCCGGRTLGGRPHWLRPRAASRHLACALGHARAPAQPPW